MNSTDPGDALPAITSREKRGTIQEILREETGTQNPILLCPVCGDSYSHVRTAYTRKGNDEGEAVDAYPHTKNNGSTPSRRSALCVLVDGETCGHSWEVVFQQHKGQTFVEVWVVNESVKQKS
jgi:hypothetical protein